MKQKPLFLLLFLAALCLDCHADAIDSIAKGDSCLADYDVASALKYYEAAFREQDCATLRQKMGECHYRQHNYAKCADVLATLPPDSLGHTAMRQLFYSYKQLAKGDKQRLCGRQIVKRWPKDGEIVAELAKAYLLNDQATQAQALCTSYWLQDKTNLAVNNVLADTYMVQQSWLLARDTYLQLLEQGDSTYKNLFSLGACYEHLTDTKDHLLKARDAFGAATQLSASTQPGALYHQGVTLNALGEHKPAMACFEAALQLLAPDSAIMFTCHRGLAEGYYAQQSYQQALYAFQEALHYNPRSYTSDYYAGICCEALEDFQNALIHYNVFLDQASKVKDPTAEMQAMKADAQKRAATMRERMLHG